MRKKWGVGEGWRDTTTTTTTTTTISTTTTTGNGNSHLGVVVGLQQTDGDPGGGEHVVVEHRHGVPDHLQVPVARHIELDVAGVQALVLLPSGGEAVRYVFLYLHNVKQEAGVYCLIFIPDSWCISK